jgi:hypothetical protein
MNKQSSILDFDSVQGLAKRAAEAVPQAMGRRGNMTPALPRTASNAMSTNLKPFTPATIKAPAGAAPVTPKFPTIPGSNPVDAQLRNDQAAQNLFNRNYGPSNMFATQKAQQAPVISHAPSRDQVYDSVASHVGHYGGLAAYQENLRQRFNKQVQRPRQDLEFNPEAGSDVGISNVQLPMKGHVERKTPLMTLGDKFKGSPGQPVTGTDLNRAVFEPGVALHELEHANQVMPPQALEAMHGAQRGTTFGRDADPITASKALLEFPATLGEVAHLTDAAEQTTGRPVAGNFSITPKYNPSLTWMRNQAKQHGYLSGDKTMTELTNTPSGQAWLKQRLEELAPPQGQQFEREVKNLRSSAGTLDWKGRLIPHHRYGNDQFEQAPELVQREAYRRWPAAYAPIRQQQQQNQLLESYQRNPTPETLKQIMLRKNYPVSPPLPVKQGADTWNWQNSLFNVNDVSLLAKMAACGDACRCGQTEDECTCPDVEKLARLVAKQASSGAWTRAEGKSESGGLNAKGRASLKAQGQNIKPPVTEDKPTGERAGRKSSFCARMGGMKKKLTSSETANDPDSRINKALRKWNC